MSIPILLFTLLILASTIAIVASAALLFQLARRRRARALAAVWITAVVAYVGLRIASAAYA